ncbi:MAG: HEPN domain-containing protein [Pseudomonadota bacterium]|nr:HEPN domain-containing protein [Pseudomonadota bacterium]
MLVDVDRVIESHADLNHEGQGRRGLGHITRGGVLLLCASWELYLEEVLLECSEVFLDRLDSPAQLPIPVQKQLAKSVRDSKHELQPLKLAGDGWKTIYRSVVAQQCGVLNTPKSNNLDPLFKRLIGIEKISQSWSVGEECVNGFVSARGDIAHRGRDAGYVTINSLHGYRELIVRSVTESDNELASYMRQSTPQDRMVWRRRTL